MVNEEPDLLEILLALSESWSDDQTETAWSEKGSMQADQGRHCALAALPMDVESESFGRTIQHLGLPGIEHQAERFFCPLGRIFFEEVIDQLKLFGP